MTSASVGSATHQWYVVHTKNHNSLVLRCILRDTTQVCLQHMVAVEERHLSVWFDPDLHHSGNENFLMIQTVITRTLYFAYCAR